MCFRLRRLCQLFHRKFEPDNHQRCTGEYLRFVAISAKNNSADDEELREARKAMIATGQFEKCRQYITVVRKCVSLVNSCLHALLFLVSCGQGP